MTDPHATALACELDWLTGVITARLTHFFEGGGPPFTLAPPPALPEGSALGQLVAAAALSPEARLVLALALAPQISPAALDPFFLRNTGIDRQFSEFGAARPDAASFVPSVVTALFLLGGGDTAARIRALGLFAPDHALRRLAGLTIAEMRDGGGILGGALGLPTHRLLALCTGQPPRPDFSPGFPARQIATRLDWDDLILPPAIRHDLDHVVTWFRNRALIRDGWGLGRRVGRGFKVLFHGPPGTGKTLTAALLGQRTGLDVFRIDLSMVVSKYIGETEKNLAQVFDMAEQNDWILFFDEADALFGARSVPTGSNDRHANQEVAYLLQRIEDCPGLVILATNLKNAIDEAFFRRFQMAVAFTRPDEGLRRALWQSILARVPLSPEVDVAALARGHELSGGSITNIVHHAAIGALRRGAATVGAHDLQQAISVEMRKEGRTA